MGNCLFGRHEFVFGLGAALAHARLRPIDCGNTGSHVSFHRTCADRCAISVCPVKHPFDILVIVLNQWPVKGI